MERTAFPLGKSLRFDWRLCPTIRVVERRGHVFGILLSMEELQFFNPKQPYCVAWKALPHWAQSGTVCFITWRTADSLPVAAERRITNKRAAALQQFESDPGLDWKEQLASLPLHDRHKVQWSLFGLLDEELDHNFGECVLAQPDLANIVGKALLHFDGERYELTDYVVMPNHVHVLVAFRDEDALVSQCTAWKRFTARQIHQALDRRGEFWQVEQFDHLVRGPDQFEHFRKYIADNSRKAGCSRAAICTIPNCDRWASLAQVGEFLRNSHGNVCCLHSKGTPQAGSYSSPFASRRDAATRGRVSPRLA